MPGLVLATTGSSTYWTGHVLSPGVRGDLFRGTARYFAAQDADEEMMRRDRDEPP